jgi:hypothetical protein
MVMINYLAVNRISQSMNVVTHDKQENPRKSPRFPPAAAKNVAKS